MRAILTYHSIDPSGSPISIGAAEFARHCRFLGSGTVRVVPLADLAACNGDAAAITFDDGFTNFAEVALPCLMENRLPATVFVPTDHVGLTNSWNAPGAPAVPSLPLMSWETLGQVVDKGIEIGAHSRTHPDLTRLSLGAIEEECLGSADRLAHELGVRPRSFAYPYGMVSDTAAQVVRRGFAQGCTTEHRVFADREDPALLPRLDAWYFRAPGLLEGWGTAAFRGRVWLRARARQVRRGVNRAVQVSHGREQSP